MPTVEMSALGRGIRARLWRGLARAERTITGLQRRAVQRREFLAQHSFELERRDLLRRLERARELQVRLAATDRLHPDLCARIGPRPADERRRQLWTRAIEETAVLCERYDSDPAAILGPAARSMPWLHEYRRIIDAVRS